MRLSAALQDCDVDDTGAERLTRPALGRPAGCPQSQRGTDLAARPP
jgi:hypothetical protein